MNKSNGFSRQYMRKGAQKLLDMGLIQARIFAKGSFGSYHTNRRVGS